MNKSVKNQIVENVMNAKHKENYEWATSVFKKEIEEYCRANSFHDEFKSLGLSDEMLRHVECKGSIHLDINDTSFFNTVSHVRFETPILAYTGAYHLQDDICQPLATYRKYVKSINDDASVLLDTVNSYRTVKKLISDLPWIEKFVPSTEKPSTDLIDITKINLLTNKFGDL